MPKTQGDAMLDYKEENRNKRTAYWTPFETSKQKCRQETETKLKTRN